MPEKKRLSIPLILSILGFLAMLPGTIEAGLMALVMQSMSEEMGQPVNYVTPFFIRLELPMILGLVGGIIARKRKKWAAGLMIGSALLLLWTLLDSLGGYSGMLTILCYFIGGILALRGPAEKTA